MATTKISDLAEMSDDDLSAEMMRRAVEKTELANKALIESVKPLVEAGWGKAPMEKAIKALEDNYLDLPRGADGQPDLRVHAEAAMRAARILQTAIANRLNPVEATAPAPTAAQP